MPSEPVKPTFSMRQAHELARLAEDFDIAVNGFKDEDGPRKHKEFHVDFYLYLMLYLTCLSKSGKDKPGGKREEASLAERRSHLRRVERAVGRVLTPDEVVQEIGKVVPVPEFSAEAIRQDVARLYE